MAMRQAEDSASERILTAALEVFAERGFDGARTRDIADRAGANLGLIKYYFDGKEKLWKAAVARAFAPLQADLAEVFQPGDGGDELSRLVLLVRRFVGFVARQPAFMRLMNDEGKRDGPRMRWLAEHFVRPMSEVVRGHLERAQTEGLLPGISPVSLHYIVVGAAGLVFSQAPECRYVAGVDPTDPEFAEHHADALIQLLTGRGGRSGSRRPKRKPRAR